MNRKIHFTLCVTECYEAVENIKDEDEDNPLNEDSNICTGPTTGGVAACNGDSGGPLVQFTTQEVGEMSNDSIEEITNENQDVYTTSSYEANIDYNNTIDADLKDDTTVTKENNNKSPIILGVVSWGASPCGQKGAPTVYTKVAPFVNFIKQYIDTSI